MKSKPKANKSSKTKGIVARVRRAVTRKKAKLATEREDAPEPVADARDPRCTEAGHHISNCACSGELRAPLKPSANVGD